MPCEWCWRSASATPSSAAASSIRLSLGSSGRTSFSTFDNAALLESTSGPYTAMISRKVAQPHCCCPAERQPLFPPRRSPRGLAHTIGANLQTLRFYHLRTQLCQKPRQSAKIRTVTAKTYLQERPEVTDYGTALRLVAPVQPTRPHGTAEDDCLHGPGSARSSEPRISARESLLHPEEPPCQQPTLGASRIATARPRRHSRSRRATRRRFAPHSRDPSKTPSVLAGSKRKHRLAAM